MAMPTGTIQPQTCDKCGKPKGGQKHGSLTQWLFDPNSCSCPLESLDSNTGQIHLCKSCGKQLPSQRKGSLTQWIFRSDDCQCARTGTSFTRSEAQIGGTSQVNSEIDSIAKVVVDRKLTAQINLPVDRYGAIEILGSGNFARVFKCFDFVLGKPVAIKLLAYTDRPEAIVRFQNEARATSVLQHENIVQIRDFGATTDSKPYMVMEYLEGKPLSQILFEKGRLPLPYVIEVMTQVCTGMSYAHAKGIFHRDLKTSNIMITSDHDKSPVVKIIDFGIAIVKSGNQSDSKWEELAGSISYMSPESIRENQFDQRSEIYSCGCIMFEILTGALPFVGETTLATLELQECSPLPDLSQFCPEVKNPEGVEAVLSTALAKDREGRFQTMEEFRCALLSLNSEPVVSSDASSSIRKQNSAVPQLLFISVLLLSVSAVALLAILGFMGVDQEPETAYLKIKRKSTEGHPLITHLDGTADGTAIKGLFAMSGVPNVDATGSSLKEELRRNPGQTSLNLSNSPVTDRDLDMVVTRPLRLIDLCDTEISDVGVRKIATIRSLQTVRLSGCHNLSDNSVAALAQLPNLTTLWIGYSGLTDNSLKSLSQARSLECLSISSNAKMRGTGLKHLSNLPSLDELWAADLDFSKQGIKALSSLTGLRKLVASDSSIDDRAMAYIARLDNLEDLNLTSTRISGKGLMLLQSKNLKILRVAECDQLTPEAVRTFRSVCPGCRVSTELPY
jgi:Serine/threonine protein kinase